MKEQITKSYSFIIVVFFITSFCCPNEKQRTESAFQSGNDILTYLRQYKCTDKNPNKETNYEFPKIPKLDKIQTLELYRNYSENKEATTQAITLLLLRLHYCNIKCCGLQYVLTQNQTEIDSLNSPIIYLFLKFSNQNKVDIIYSGIGTSNVYMWANKQKNLKNDSLISKEIVKIKGIGM